MVARAGANSASMPAIKVRAGKAIGQKQWLQFHVIDLDRVADGVIFGYMHIIEPIAEENS